MDKVLDEKNDKLRYKFILKIIRGKTGGFGPGIADLMRGIEQTGSLNQASKNMGMAYSKAWKILRNVENELGVYLIERKGPAGSDITPQGKEILNAFTEMERAIDNVLEKLFKKFPID